MPQSRKTRSKVRTKGRRRDVLGVRNRVGKIWIKWRNTDSLARRSPDAPLQLIGYLGYHSGDAMHIRARVLTEQALPEPGNTTWSRMRAMMALYNIAELVDIPVHAEIDGQRITETSDEDGHVKIRMPSNRPTTQITRWDSVALTATAADGSTVQTQVPIIVPGRDVNIGVISDIDDTILETGTTNFLRNWRRVLIETAEERLAVPGAVKLYRALAGSASNPVRPFFYVSTSPWNLFSMLTRFKHLNGLPAGPMFLTRFDLTSRKKRIDRTVEHKFTAIEKILESYPNMQFLLIGDSAQHDIIIYHQAINRHPERFLAVIIRDVEERARNPENAAALTAINKAGLPIHVAPTLADATAFLKRQGLDELLVGA